MPVLTHRSDPPGGGSMSGALGGLTARGLRSQWEQINRPPLRAKVRLNPYAPRGCGVFPGVFWWGLTKSAASLILDGSGDLRRGRMLGRASLAPMLRGRTLGRMVTIEVIAQFAQPNSCGGVL